MGMKTSGQVLVLCLAFAGISTAAQADLGPLPGGPPAPTGDSIPAIVLDKDGQPTQVSMSSQISADHLPQWIATVNDSVLPILDKIPPSRGWMLRTVAVGMTVQVEVDAGKFDIGFLPRGRLVYTNNKTPTWP